MMLPGTLLLFAAGAIFEMHAFPVTGPASEAFPAPTGNRGRADLVVMNDAALTIYPDAVPENPQTLRFPEGVSAVDIFDLNDDGAAEIIAVVKEHVLVWSLSGELAATEPVTLFQAKTQLVHAPGPFPYVLGFEAEGRPVLGLPGETSFDLRDISGALVASTPMDVTAPHRASYGQPFSAEPAHGLLLGSANALELDVRRSIEIEPALPPQLANIERGGLLRRRAAAPSANSANDSNSAYWPWFTLDAATPGKVPEFARWDILYATDAENEESFIRLRNPAAATKAASRVSPPRRFPGVLLNTESITPDFNGDGLVDLLLWSDPTPGFSIDHVVRLLTMDRRSVRFTAHCFDTKRARFSSAATASVLLDARALPRRARQENAAPVHLLVVDDFDGDGRSDLGCALTETEFGVWRFTEAGFSTMPEFSLAFPEPLHSVEFCESLAPNEGCSIGLRGENTLYLLRATAPARAGGSQSPRP